MKFVIATFNFVCYFIFITIIIHNFYNFFKIEMVTLLVLFFVAFYIIVKYVFYNDFLLLKINKLDEETLQTMTKALVCFCLRDHDF